jgi:hypothetical protein
MKTLSILFLVFALSVSMAAETSKANELSPEEKAAGWKLLFDGATINGWRAIGTKEAPKKGWVIADGCLKHEAKGGGGDIVANDPYENYELSWEWKIAPGANSGVKYRVEDKGSSAFGPEYQLIDDEKHSDAKNLKHSTGALYEMFEPKEKKAKPAGEFNHSRLIVNGAHVEHWLNGTKVVEFEFFNDDWNKAFATSKYVKNPNFAKNPKSFIALQDHGDEISFRNIKIKELAK